jgi:chorismate dehydratase
MAQKVITRNARLGKINYANTTPFYHGLFDQEDAISYFEGSPVEINQAMRLGDIDIAPISSLEYALNSDHYVLLPDLCIGSRDFARSVLLFSHEKIEGLDEETIVLTNKSLSSQALLKIILHFKYGFKNKFELSGEAPGILLNRAKAVLSIGDQALFYKPKKFLYKYDLSELWWDWMELPFCFALWAVRKEFFKTHQSEVIQLHAKLHQRLEANLMDLEKLIKEELDVTIADERFGPLFGYLFNLNYLIDDQMEKGLLRFFDLASQLKLAPRISKLEFIKI